MTPNPAAQYGAYRQTQLQTASPTELVVMLYRGALRFTRAGIDGVNRRDIGAAHTGFVRAQEIITELSATLDVERGGKLAQQLRTIYTYVGELLIRANVTKSSEPAEHALQLLEELLSAWQQVQEAAAASPRSARVA